MRYLFTKILLGIYKITYGKYLKIKYSITCEKIGVDSINGPYIILSNHVNNLDPFFINLFINRPISFVVSEAFFRKPILGKILEITNMIPKKKFVSDMKTIRKILRFIKRGYIIGIFPEGRRTWNGVTDKLNITTARLIKKLNIPVVVVNINGGMLSKPRWATYSRKGNINIIMRKIFDDNTLRKISVEEINKIIHEYMYNDEYKVQVINKRKYKGRKLAEKIEKFLFICPICKKIDTIVSINDHVICNNCKMETLLNVYGYFDKQFIFNNPYQWDKWQRGYLYLLISKVDNKSIITEDDDLIISKSNINKKNKVTKIGKITLYKNKININIKNQVNVIPLKFIKGLNVQSNNKLELIDRDFQYTIKSNKKVISFYKWQFIINALKKEI